MNKPITEIFEGLDKLIKVLLYIFVGGIIGGAYRIIRYTETKNTTTLVIGILWFITGNFFGIGWIVDLVTLITKNRITVLAD